MASVTINAVDADPACVGPPNICLPPYSFFGSETDAGTGAVVFGWAIGLGVDWEVFPNLFVRGEYEYMSLPNIQSNSFTVNSVRFGAGIKF
jgi:opacity protein-like surface antigen